MIGLVRFIGPLWRETDRGNTVATLIEVMNMDKKVKAVNTDKGIQIDITADDPAAIQEIQEHKQWYSDMLREHEPQSAHGVHHREHHGSHARHGER
jgi:hypothetical protein